MMSVRRTFTPIETWCYFSHLKNQGQYHSGDVTCGEFTHLPEETAFSLNIVFQFYCVCENNEVPYIIWQYMDNNKHKGDFDPYWISIEFGV